MPFGRVATRWLTKKGHYTSLCRLFAFLSDNDCNRLVAEAVRRVNAPVPPSPEPFHPESCQAPVLHAGKDR